MTATTFDQKLFDRICERIAEGESLIAICKTKDYPVKRTVLRWVAKDETLAAQYAEAQNMRADHYFDQIIDIADKGSDPAKTRVQVDARKWVLARMNPKKYGDKFTQELTGSEGGPLVVEIVRHGDPDA